MNKTLFIDTRVHGYPGANSVLCENGRISGIDKNLNPESACRIVSLHGGYLYPGFNDTHLHLYGIGEFLDIIQLHGISSLPEIVKAITARLRSREKAEKPAWFRGMGWDQNIWEQGDFPDKRILDSISTEIPVCLSRVDGHAFWVNSRALELAGIDADTPDPPGGKILKDADGKDPSGILVDRAMDLITNAIPPVEMEKHEAYLRNAITYLHSFGITSLGDAGTAPETIRALVSIHEDAGLAMRVNSMIPWRESADEYRIQENEFLTANTFKIFLDGALGSRGAALFEPYSDDPDNSGLIFEDTREVASFVSEVNRQGFQVAIHAIGDRANHLALNIFESASFPETRSVRNRIEHAQIIAPEDLGRFKALNVIPSVQPLHCTSDLPWIEKKLGEDRIENAYPFNSMVRSGNRLIGGSDAPVESPDPLKGMYAAATRQRENDDSGQPWFPDERLSPGGAFRLYTSWAAHATYDEHRKGSLSEGYLADMVVLSDPLDFEDPSSFLSTESIATIVNGELVYETF